jgi:hypothetical protein
VGVEVIFTQGLPSSLGVSAGYLNNQLSTSGGYIQCTGIMPITGGSGIFGEATYYITEGIPNTINVGILTSGQLR